MGIYKLGYLNDLDNSGVIANWDAGKAAYDKFGGVTLDMDTTKMCRAIGRVDYIYDNDIWGKNIINYPNIGSTIFNQAILDSKFEINEFNNGFIRFLSGVARNKVFKIYKTFTTLILTDDHPYNEGVRIDDYFEVVSGSCTFDFPTERNPTNQNVKRAVVNRANRFPFSQGSLVMFEGYQPDDFVLFAHLTTREAADRLEIMLNHSLDYVGFDGPYSYDTISGSDEGLAPMILETGSHDTKNQYLVYINDYKIIRDAKYNDEFSEVTIHFLNYSGVIYRGV